MGDGSCAMAANNNIALEGEPRDDGKDNDREQCHGRNPVSSVADEKAKEQMPATPASDIDVVDHLVIENAPGDEIKRIFCEYIHPMLPVLSPPVLRDLFEAEGNNHQFIHVLRLAVKAVAATYTTSEEGSVGRQGGRQQIITSFYNKAVVRGQTTELIKEKRC